ncbi:hypothetical protein [Rubrivirga sp. IMCC43871]|uniref:hypothetical protein n=1 Tax=Rubrivirga sp. IMCC43871 TaxID=3391575 RepID=UPI00398FBF61
MSDHIVRPVEDYLTEYRAKKDTIVKTIQNDPDLSLPEKLQAIERELNNLRDDFSEERTEEYESKSVTKSKNFSCTKGNSGGSKICKDGCVSSPHPGMYTTRQWTTFGGSGRNHRIGSGGRSACLDIKISGRGRKTASITSVFRYNPSYVRTEVLQDVTDLFNMMSDSAEIASIDVVDDESGAV